ncbi:MAG: M23 family metallopeptidase [Gemmatimonadota bacterium]|nr:M23 family metallopeptidase [Gemmatimonadota bacterium]
MGTRAIRIVSIATAVAGCAGGARPTPVAPNEEPRDPSTDHRATEDPARSGPGGTGARLEGGCGFAPTALTPKYLLPFPEGELFTLTQGNCGRASHAGRFRYSFDFEMPIGTPVIAARDGVVFTVRGDRSDGTGRVGDENFIILEHEDGEYSRYIHLTRAGVFVLRGQAVSRGDTIGLSGHSGRSAFPHLHFDVAEACRAGPCQTVPSAFLNAEPPIPSERRTYSARGGSR